MIGSIEQRRAALVARFPTWSPATLDGFLDDRAAEFPDRPLVVTDDGADSYAEVAAQSRRWADGLAALGVRPGDHVGLLLANFREFAALKFAIARVGAVAVPFNYLYRAAELAYVLRQSRVGVLITMTGYAGQDQLAVLDAAVPGWATGAVDHPRTVVTVPTGGPGRPGVLTTDGLAELGERHRDAHREPVAAVPDRAHRVGDMLYTSGTTGLPKGVLVSHDAVLRTGYASALTRAFEDGRRILFSLPCYHMFGYVEGLLAALMVGGAIVPRVSFSAADYLAAAERHRASEILCVPTMTVALLEHPDRRDRNLSSLLAMLSGAAPGPMWLWARVREELRIGELTTGYGMTECGGAMTMTLPEDGLERHADTVGRPKLAGAAGRPDGDLCAYRTVDPLTGAPLPEGAEGELVSTGPTHMLGFWGKPAETAEALRDGWVYSGDLGRLDEHGYLRLTGRSKELYKSGGELVMPKEVEDLLTRHPGISQAYAVGVPDERWGEIGCACVVPEPGARPDPEELIALCRDKLARFKVPKHVLLLAAEELPTTPTGKVQKFRLARLAAQRLAGGDAPDH